MDLMKELEEFYKDFSIDSEIGKSAQKEFIEFSLKSIKGSDVEKELSNEEDLQKFLAILSEGFKAGWVSCFTNASVKMITRISKLAQSLEEDEQQIPLIAKRGEVPS